MAYKNLILGCSPITKTIFAGRLNKKGNMWIDKKDVTEDFLKCAIQYFMTENDEKNVIEIDGKPAYEITCKKL